jgi:polynucleotide 5'-hydroxyl-kinase GRC3/NOL9
MLSAVAARKARQPTLPNPKTSAKRRQSHHAKARKRSRSENNATQQRALTPQKDVVLPNRSDDDSGMSVDLDQENVAPSQPEQSLDPVQPEHRRAWSPSRLAFDSDGASDANETPFSGRPQFPSYSNHPMNEEHDIPFTYQPSSDRNMFQLSLDEGSSLGLGGPAVALVLFPSATVSLVGTYRLRVLHGSVSLLGAIVRPSQVVHQVFAPSSSPIPIVQALAARGESSKSLSDVPARILSTIGDGDVVIVLQDLQTGVEGLGRVVRTFEGVFDDAHSKGILVGPLQGVHFVSHSFLENTFFLTKGHQTSQAARGLRAFQLLPSWEVALSESPFSSANATVEFSKLPVVLVKGQKNSGKSTFARTIVNRLSSRCAPSN